MKLSQIIEVMSLVLSQHVEKSKFAWEKANTGTLTDDERKRFQKMEQVEGGIVEAFCLYLGVEVTWPGLYPAYRFGGFEYHHLPDVLAAVKGHATIAMLKEHENGK